MLVVDDIIASSARLPALQVSVAHDTSVTSTPAALMRGWPPMPPQTPTPNRVRATLPPAERLATVSTWAKPKSAFPNVSDLGTMVPSLFVVRSACMP